MRIVGGKHKGRRLVSPGDRAIRPTSDRAREAVFNLLTQGRLAAETGLTLSGADVLDAFCGSGALGLEALSRGAGTATFLDADVGALDLARDNAEAMGEAKNARFLRGDATRPPRPPHAHGLAFLDPPYGKDLARAALIALASGGWLEEGAVVVIEQGSEEELAVPFGFEPVDERQYGAAKIVVLQYGAPDEAA
jgi:16S rRNA (guanine966-N2)-methyltransferase